MKLKYKKMIIILSAATLVLAFVILMFIPTGGTSTGNITDANLSMNSNKEINKLIESYLNAKKDVDIDALGPLVSDPNQINRDLFTAMAEYVEDYKNLNCYVLKNEEANEYRVYAQYDSKLKNIDTLVPCLGAFYVTVSSDGKYLVYLSALDEDQREFIDAADKNEEIVKLKEDISLKLNEAIEKDPNFKQFYQKMDKEIKSKNATNAAAQ